MLELEISPAKVAKFLGIIIGLLFLAHVVGRVLVIGFGHTYAHGFIPLFDLDKEKNVPSFYSASAMILCSILLTIVAVTEKRLRRSGYVMFWGFLAFAFLFLAYDELFMVHEQLNFLRLTMNTSGLLYFAWVLPYAALAATVCGLSLRFVIGLPKHVRFLVFLSGIIYISGALGMESISASIFEYSDNSNADIRYVFVTTLEELMEMFGVVIFIRALLEYLNHLGLRMTFSG